MIDEKKAEQLIQSVFTFDKVGETMTEVRRNLSSEDLQKRLIKELVEYAIPMIDDKSAESLAIITKAAEARVQRFVEGSKAAKGSRCGG